MAIKGKQIIEVPERTSLTGEEYIPFQDRSINGRIKSSLLKGLKGDKGDRGEQGFPGSKGVKGDKGEPGTNGKDGKTPAIEATATIANTTGTPSVKVTKSENTDSTSFSFAFSGLKGERGEQGAQGLKGDKGDSGIMSSVLIEGATPTQSISPNKFYKFESVTTLTITFSPKTPNVLNEYMFQFTSGETATVLNMPDSVRWIGDHTIEPNKTYQVSIVNNLAVIGGAS